MTSTDQHIRFLFDPTCPWTWRTSLWIREAARVRPITIEWSLLSLAYLNREHADAATQARNERRKPALRLFARAEQHNGQSGIDQLYLALGTAVHVHKQSLETPEVLAAALTAAELPAELLTTSEDDAVLDAELEAKYAAAVASGVFGVPTLYFGDNPAPYFGPVIDPPPQGETAGQLWDHVYGIAQHPYFYELKRNRG